MLAPNLGVRVPLNPTPSTASPPMCWGNAPIFASEAVGKKERPRFDEQNAEYLSGYPGGRHWINPWISAIHGKYVRSDSATMSVYARKNWRSVIAGHIHRIERIDQTAETTKGPRSYVFASPGCLCRITGVVPSTNGGMDIHGRPIENPENWQQGTRSGGLRGLRLVLVRPGEYLDGRVAVARQAVHGDRGRGMAASISSDRLRSTMKAKRSVAGQIVSVEGRHASEGDGG